MSVLSLKPTHKAVAAYYASLAQFEKLGITHESAVRSAFQTLLDHCARQVGRVLVPEYRVKRKGGKQVIADGAILDQYTKVFNLGLWEAKDTADDLEKEIKAKFAAGYPRENILFQAPHRAVLYQGGERFHDADLTKPAQLVEVLGHFFSYRPPVFDEWEKAVDEFKARVPELGANLAKLIRAERHTNAKYKAAFTDFLALCRASLNPNLAEDAVEEMIVQHLLTERIFRKVFDVGEFMRRNVIAVEIEKVITALTSRSFDRDRFTKNLEHFYVAIERAAETLNDFSEKQKFLNTVYERFFQGFCVKVADTHGIVYTPQSPVDFMVASVEHVLREHFDTGLAEKNVHILDPFTGTGNFIVNLMERIPASALPHKYAHELFCNEVMLLPYYVASMNIEHKYWEKVGTYEPFEGICLVDTFETAEKEQGELFSMTEENTARVKRQRAAPIKVIVANPPYNAGQINENDNNKNRKYPEIDRRVKVTYSDASKATLRNSLSDPYIKAIRWASDRIGDCGVVCYITNNGFVEGIACDGMRQHLAKEFDLVYILDLGGNVRKNPKLSGTTHNVFGIQVGVCISVFIRLPGNKAVKRNAKIYYHATPTDWRREEKCEYLDKCESIAGVEWRELTPNPKHDWLTGDNDPAFAAYLPIGGKEAKASGGSSFATVFRSYCRGFSTGRDEWIVGFGEDDLTAKTTRLVENYNTEVTRYAKTVGKKKKTDDFVASDSSFVKWTDRLKESLEKGEELTFNPKLIRRCLYRPFTPKFVYFDDLLVHRRYLQTEFFPDAKAEKDNIAISLTDIGGRSHFSALAVKGLTELHLCATVDTFQCFPLYTYSADGKARRDNIPRSTLDRFAIHYDDDAITRADIFHYVYAVLHHPEYRARYAENLKRELPRIPFAPDFHAFAKAGAKLAELHVHYERQKEWKLQRIEDKDTPLDWRVEAMKLTRERDALIYNEHFTFAGIPPEAHEYRLGNRSALDWVIDQYRVTRDAEGRIASDPNRDADEPFIARLLAQVVTVSVETMKLVRALPPLGLP